MALPRLTKLELQVMEALWSRGASSVREIQEAFPEPERPAAATRRRRKRSRTWVNAAATAAGSSSSQAMRVGRASL